MKDKKNAGLLRFSELIQRLKQMLPKETFGNMDVKTAVTLLANHGLVMQLKFGDLLLLKPELLNGYASAVIRAARAHTDEIGCVAERDVFEKNIDFEGVDRLPDADEQLLLRAMVQTFMDKSLCIAEDTPEGKQLIFPSQYRRERPIPGYPEIFVSYTFTGELATVYTTLVVRLWYSREFYNKELWYNAAEFITSKEKTAGMVMKRTGEGEGTINVFFETGVPDELKLVFIKYVHEHLLKYARDVRRDRRYVCPNCGTPVEDREVVRMRLEDKKDFLYCQSCDEKILLIDQIEQRLISDPIVRKVFDMDRTAMRELDIQALEQILVGHMMAICGEANQIFRPLSMFDYGIDGEVEFKDNYGKASGKKIYVQLKSSSSHIRERKRDEKLIFDVKNPRHLEYWQNQSVDVYLVIRDAEEVIRWMNVTKYLRSHKNKKSRQIVFEGEELDASTLWRLRDNYLAISSPSPRKLIEPSIKEKEFATRLTQEGFEYLAKGELDTATEIFMNCLSMTKNNSDAVTGLIRVVQRTYKGSPSRANKILDQLIGKAPLSFAGQFCENLKLAEVTLAEELLVLVKRCILPITFLASKTGGLGWEIELTAIESQKVVNTNSVNAEYKGEDEVIINANIQDLPWGKYSLVVRFMAEGHEIWGGEKTIVNEDLKNPYIFGPPIRHGDRFFGRQDLINDLKWKLKDASVTLLGPRRSGKTSVLFQLREACKDDWAVVFIDLHSFSGLSTQNVLHDIIDEVQRACLPDHTPPENPKDLRTLRWLLDKAKVLRLLILLDEMAVLAEHPAVAFQLRALSKWTTPTARVVATGTVADLEKVVDSALEMHGSPPMNEFINLELDDISKHDAKELVQKPVLGKYRYQPDALSIILELGAGRPFFLNMLAHFALKSVQSEGTRLIERRHIEVARQESIYALDRWYPSLIGEIDDQTRTILPKLVKTPYKHLEHFMARSLRNAGLTIGPRSNLCLDPLFIDWWNQNKKENIKT
jgi:predicted SprT family Zn-dependent metalloprotease